ncbi:hypothetical protein OIU79_024610 [Salix purpurea]|uniref:Uncharacterized protein n=1 Tax=Salix purpurea TaxID=77065 RepID=A0A9Q0SD49_SALPP|nr:hypothetical protein OIU79_024610 [Salix purpurea]
MEIFNKQLTRVEIERQLDLPNDTKTEALPPFHGARDIVIPITFGQEGVETDVHCSYTDHDGFHLLKIYCLKEVVVAEKSGSTVGWRSTVGWWRRKVGLCVDVVMSVLRGFEGERLIFVAF